MLKEENPVQLLYKQQATNDQWWERSMTSDSDTITVMVVTFYEGIGAIEYTDTVSK